MASFVIATFDGAGNLVPTLGIARALVERGHDVRMVGHETIRDRCGDQGTRFIPLTQPAEGDEVDIAPDDSEAEVDYLINQLCFSPTIAGDVAAALERERADAIVVDCMLFSALTVAEASPSPAATLVHTPYSIFREGPVVEMFSPGLELLNPRRAALGLPPLAQLSDAHDACDLALVAVPKEFEPDVVDAANVVRIGPMLDAPPLAHTGESVDVADGSAPLVLVSLSTSEQGQLPLLQRIADAVATLPVRAIITTGPSLAPSAVTAGANTQVVRYVPHAEVLPAAAMVITHAGLGTTMSSLGSGVPLLCTPMGRDQFFNAESVASMGAGLMLQPDADVEAIAAAARIVLDDPQMRAAAKQAAVTIAGYGGAAAAVAELEALAVTR